MVVRYYMPKGYAKKTIYLNQDYINKAIKIFNVKTEKDAVNKALEVVIEESEIIETHNEIGGSGVIERIYR
jgi:Arc/MetJ family transcription regulator